MKQWYILVICVSLAIMTSCQTRTNDIVGVWERVGDYGEGSVVEVEKVGGFFQAKLIDFPLTGLMAEMAFQKGDMKWRNVNFIQEGYYQGEDLLKIVNTQGEVVSTRYDPIHLELLSQNVLEIRAFAAGDEFIGTVQRWNRMIPEGEKHNR